MRIIKASAEILWPGQYKESAALFFPKESTPNWAERSEFIGRLSHRSEDRAGTDPEKFLDTWCKGAGHWAIGEFIDVTVLFTVDRGISHELVRHRLASYLQESTRYINYEKKMPASFIYPIVGVECPLCLAGVEKELEGSPSDGYEYYHADDDCTSCAYDHDWLYSIERAEEQYKRLITKGWKPQDARSVLPNALATKIAAKMNLRTWRHVFAERVSLAAHPQMREVMIPLLAEFKQLFAPLFDDVVPSTSAQTLKELMQ